VNQVVNSLRIDVEHNESMLQTARGQYRSCLDTVKRTAFSHMRTPVQFPWSKPSRFDTFGDFRIHNYEDRSPPDCNEYYQSVQMVEDAVRVARKKLDRALKAKSAVEESIEVYNRSEEKLEVLVTDTADNAKAFLERKARDIREYDRIDPPNISHETSIDDEQSDDPFQSEADVEVKAPQTVLEASSSGTSDPKDMGHSQDSDRPDKIRKKDAHRKLQKMLPSIESGEGGNSEYWRAKDEVLGLTYPKGYQRVYDTFYGQKGLDREKTE